MTYIQLVNSAAQAHYWASQPGAKPEALNRRNRQIFYLAVLIGHEMQEVMHLSGTDQGEGPFRIVQPGRWGLNLEREVVGGVVIGFRIPPVQKETPVPIRFPVSSSFSDKSLKDHLPSASSDHLVSVTLDVHHSDHTDDTVEDNAD